MEHFSPRLLMPESTPDRDPPEGKSRWRVLELFKTHQNESTSEQTKEAPVKTDTERAKRTEAPERRKLASTVMTLLQGESQEQRPSLPAESIHPPAAERAAAVSSLPVAAERPITPMPSLAEAEQRSRDVREALQPAAEVQVTFVERAKEVGRHVLALINRARHDVQEADSQENVPVPTDIEPLAEADANVRAAMQELVAPIEALQAGNDTVERASAIQTERPAGAGLEAGRDDYNAGLLSELDPSVVGTIEVAAAVAGAVARETLEAKERATKRSTTLRKVGLFALGAATVGGFVYTWRRVRQIKKEQRELRKEHKRFEAEVRLAQSQEEQRLRQLESTNAQQLSQPERQRYVREVSEFAHTQASEIRKVARTQETIAASVDPPVENAMPQRPSRQPVVLQTPEAMFRVPAQPENTASTVYTPEYRQPAAIQERGNAGERPVQAQAGDRSGGAFGAGGMAASGAGPSASGAEASPYQGAATPQRTAPEPKQHTQAWLWGLLLGGAVVIFVILWGLGIL